MSQEAYILTTEDHTLLEILLERHADADAAFRSLLRKKLARSSVVVRDVIQRWSRILRQGHKVDLPMRRTIQHEDTQTVFSRVQGQGRA